MSSGDEHPAGGLTRRKLLAASAGAAAVVGGVFGTKIFRQPGATVLTMRCGSYDDDLLDLCRQGIQAFPRVVAAAKGAHVVLKPNLVEVHPGRPINTDPRLVAAVAAAFLEEGAGRVTVAEGPGHIRDTEAILELTGLDDLLRPLGVPFVDLNTDEPIDVPLAANYTGLGKLPIARTIMQADLVVSMPKLKTHHWAGATLSMKNLFGTVPSAVFGWPKNPLHWAGIPKSIADLWDSIRPGFAIVDGIVGMEGDGPIMGTPVHHGVLVFGDQCPAVDATAARMMRIRADRLTYLTRAVEIGGTLSSLRITTLGDAVAPRDYALLDHFDFLRAR